MGGIMNENRVWHKTLIDNSASTQHRYIQIKFNKYQTHPTILFSLTQQAHVIPTTNTRAEFEADDRRPTPRNPQKLSATRVVLHQPLNCAIF